jgi:hypothetical protein
MSIYTAQSSFNWDLKKAKTWFKNIYAGKYKETWHLGYVRPWFTTYYFVS